MKLKLLLATAALVAPAPAYAENAARALPAGLNALQSDGSSNLSMSRLPQPVGRTAIERMRGLKGESLVQEIRDMFDDGTLRLAPIEKSSFLCGTEARALPSEAEAGIAAMERLFGFKGDPVADGSDPDQSGFRIDPGSDGVVTQPYFGQPWATLRTRSEVQTVFIQFDRSPGQEPTFDIDIRNSLTNQIIGVIEDVPDYVFTPADRAEIADRVRADLEPYGINVVTTEPSSGNFVRMTLADNDAPIGSTNVTFFVNPDTGGAGFSVLFGRADEIDFANDNLGSGAFTDISLWVAIADAGFFADPVAAFEFFSGIAPADVDNDGEVDDDKITEAVVNQGSNTTSHEIGHTLGLRHYDSLGPIGTGFKPNGQPGGFLPAYPGPFGAVETDLHVMASGASVGLPIVNSTTENRTMSARSALKMQLASFPFVVQTEEQVEAGQPLFGFLGQGLSDRVLAPGVTRVTTTDDTTGAPRRTLLRTNWVQGTIEGPDGVDTYAFRGIAGERVNAEVISSVDFLIADDVFTTVRLNRIEPDGTRTLIAENIDEFESFDSFIVDAELPSTGVYEVEVTAPDEVFFDIDGDGQVPDPLTPFGFGNLISGDYDLLIYRTNPAIPS